MHYEGTPCTAFLPRGAPAAAPSIATARAYSFSQSSAERLVPASRFSVRRKRECEAFAMEFNNGLKERKENRGGGGDSSPRRLMADGGEGTVLSAEG